MSRFLRVGIRAPRYSDRTVADMSVKVGRDFVNSSITRASLERDCLLEWLENIFHEVVVEQALSELG